MEVSVHGVPISMLPDYGAPAMVCIAPALEHGKGLYEVRDVTERLEDGRMQLWVATEGDRVVAAVVSSVEDYPRKRALELHFCGGDSVDEWLPQIMELLERFGRAQGCDLVTIVGRRGWAKKLPDYETTDAILSKGLT